MIELENIPWNMREEEEGILIDNGSYIYQWLTENFPVSELGRTISVDVPIGTVLPNGCKIEKSPQGFLYYTKKRIVKKTRDELADVIDMGISFFNLGKET